MIAKNQKFVFLLLFLLSLIMVCTPLATAAEEPSSQDQIVIPGRARFYSTSGAEVLVSPVLGRNAVVSVEKSIAATETENEFDLTLTVKTSVDISEVLMSADAAVVLVLDISGSMGGINDAGIDYSPALKASAQNFINSLAAEAGDSARYVTLVTFETDARIVFGWTDITNYANRLSVNNYIQNLKAEGATFMHGGLLLGRNLMRTDALPIGRDNMVIENRCVILFSDGEANKYTIWPYEAAYTTGTVVPSTSGPGNGFDPQSIAATEIMATELKTQTNFQTYSKHTAYLYTIAFGSAAPTNWLRSNIATNPTYAYTAANASDLNAVFAAIAKRIESWAEAWVVTDPMGPNIDFISTISPADQASGLLDFQNNMLSWDLKKATPDSFVNDIYTYTYTYRVRLDTSRSTYTPQTAYPTNRITELTYVMLEDDVIVSDILIATFATPEVKGYAGGSLAFSKVGGNTTALPGCVFALTNQVKSDHSLSAISTNGTGAVSFPNIPSGYTYTLAETFMPGAYEGLYVKSNETYNVLVSYGDVSVTDSLGNPVDIAAFKFNNPSEGRKITGLVLPQAVEDIWGVGNGFLSKHDVVVELRPTFLTPAPPALSTKAVLMNNLGLGQFTFENVPFGEYVLYIKRPGYLARPMLVTVNESSPAEINLAPPNPAENGIFRLWGGDCNDDGLIDNVDIIMIFDLMTLRVNALDPRYLADCDLNADGLIDTLDFQNAYENWGKNILAYSGAEGVDPFI